MFKRVMVSTIAVLVMYLVVFLSAWVIVPLNSSDELIAVLILLSFSLVFALIVVAGASFASWWVSLVFLTAGIFSIVLGILLSILEPEGIITPFIFSFGIGLFIGGLTVLVVQLRDRDMRNRSLEMY